MIENIKTYATIWWIIIFWAIANSMQLILQKIENQQDNKVWEIIANFLLASFWWLIAGLVAKLVIDDIIWINIAAGIGWYAGVNWLNKLKDAIFENLVNLLSKKNDKGTED